MAIQNTATLITSARREAFSEAAHIVDGLADEYHAKAIAWGDDSGVVLCRASERAARKIAALLRVMAGEP